VKKFLILSISVLMVLSVLGIIGCDAEDEDVADNGDDEEEEQVEEIDYPTQEILIQAGHGAGGSTDLVMRTLAPYLQDRLGEPVVVENVPGAGGGVAAESMFAAEPDGYTLNNLNVPSYPSRDVFENFPSLEDATFIHGITGQEYPAVVVREDSGIEDLDDLVEYVEENEPVTYSTTNPPSNSGISSLMFQDAVGVDMQMVPYESGTEAIMACVGGHTEVAFGNIVSLRTVIEEEDLKLITYFAEEDSEEGVTRFAEKYPGYTLETAVGLMGPPGMDDAVVEILADAIGDTLQDEAFLEDAEGQFNVQGRSPEEWEEFTHGAYDFLMQYEDLILDFLED